MERKLFKLTGIGADVEVFVQDKSTKEIISAEGMVKGTKQHPYVFDDNPHFATSLDNVLAEFGIPPATNKVEFYNYLQKSLAFINSTLPDHICTAILPAAELDEKWLKTRQARKFGCDPDFNAYTGQENERPYSRNYNLRSAGGHIHVGYSEAFDYEHFNDYTGDPERCEVVKALDLFLGVPSVLLEPDNKRKELYGKAGAYRPKPYGLEYRTMSNFYLQSKSLTYWAYQAVTDAFKWLNEGNTVEEGFGSHVAYIINHNDKDEAQRLILDMGLLNESLLKRAA
jgi:hypothetical protein